MPETRVFQNPQTRDLKGSAARLWTRRHTSVTLV